jgi:hypothetical protein
MPHSCCSRPRSGTAQLGGYLPLAFAASTVRYPIPERIFDYVSMARSAMTGTCQLRTRVLQDAAVLAVVGGWRKIIV